MRFLVSVTDWEGMSYSEATDWCVRAFYEWESLTPSDKRKLLEWGSALARADCDDESGVLVTGKFPLSGSLLADIYERYVSESHLTLGWVLGCGLDTIRRRINAARNGEDED